MIFPLGAEIQHVTIGGNTKDMHEAFASGELSEGELKELIKKKAVDLEQILVKGLWDGRTVMRRNCALALQVMGNLPVEHTNLLLIAAKDTDSVVRKHCVVTIDKLKLASQLAIPIFLAAATDKDQEVATAAIEALGNNLSRSPKEVGPYIIASLGDRRPFVQVSCFDLVIKHAKPLEPALLVGLRDPNGLVRKNVRQILRLIGTPITEPLAKLLAEPLMRDPVESVLMGVDDLSPKAEKLLETYVTDDDASLNRLAGRILNHHYQQRNIRAGNALAVEIPHFAERPLEPKELEGAKKGADVGALAVSVRDGRHIVRQNAAALLGLVVGDDAAREEAVAALTPLTKDPNLGVRATVVRTLGKLGGPAAAPFLVKAAADRDRGMADAIAEALGHAAQSAPDAMLAAVTADTSTRTFRAVAKALSETGAKTVPSLTAALSEAPNAMTRRLAAQVLGNMGKTAAKAVVVLVAALAGDTDEGVRAGAARALGRLEDSSETVLDALKFALDDSVPDVRREAAYAADRLNGKPEELQVLEPQPFPLEGFETEALDAAAFTKVVKKLDPLAMRLLLSDGRAPVRMNAASALAALGKDAEGAAFQLALTLKDSDDAVRMAAAQAIGAIKSDPGACVPALVGAADGASDAFFKALITALKAYGKVAIEPTLDLLRNRPEVVTKTVLPVIQAMSKTFLKPLAQTMLDGANLIMRENAVDLIAHLGREAAAHEKELLEALENDELLYRAKVIEAIGQVVKPSKAINKRLRELKDTDTRPSIVTAIRWAEKYLSAQSKA